MPEALERKLKAEAKKKGFSKERTGAYVYGTMREVGWKPSREKHNPVTSPVLTGIDSSQEKTFYKKTPKE